jgi:hypothetical protein
MYIFALPITNFTCPYVLYLVTVTHPVVTLTNFWIHGVYRNINGVTGRIYDTSGECFLG